MRAAGLFASVFDDKRRHEPVERVAALARRLQPP